MAYRAVRPIHLSEMLSQCAALRLPEIALDGLRFAFDPPLGDALPAASGRLGPLECHLEYRLSRAPQVHSRRPLISADHPDLQVRALLCRPRPRARRRCQRAAGASAPPARARAPGGRAPPLRAPLEVAARATRRAAGRRERAAARAAREGALCAPAWLRKGGRGGRCRVRVPQARRASARDRTAQQPRRRPRRRSRQPAARPAPLFGRRAQVRGASSVRAAAGSVRLPAADGPCRSGRHARAVCAAAANRVSTRHATARLRPRHSGVVCAEGR